MVFKFNENSKKWKNVKSVKDWIRTFNNSKKNDAPEIDPDIFPGSVFFAGSINDPVIIGAFILYGEGCREIIHVDIPYVQRKFTGRG